jgi:hypothetical protein
MCNACNNICCGSDQFYGCGCESCGCPDCEAPCSLCDSVFCDGDCCIDDLDFDAFEEAYEPIREAIREGGAV